MNLPASVRQRLLNLAHERNESFQRILLQYAFERLLYRLSQSSVRDRFVLKGALLFAAWTQIPHRPTQDLDLLGYGSPEQDNPVKIFENVCEAAVEPDGIIFHPDSIQVEDIMGDAEYNGIRVSLFATLDSAKIPLRIDIGYGDSITPESCEIIYPCLLDYPAPLLRAYPPESVVAEKFQAIVFFGMANSRMKDYYDLWVISRHFSFDGRILSSAIRNTFNRRKTSIPAGIPSGLSAEFAGDREKNRQWCAFLNRIGLQDTQPELSEVIDQLCHFLFPPLAALRKLVVFESQWPPSGPWSIP
jgi:hypothetical protein